MKAFAELKRRQVSAAVAVAPQPDEDFDYHPLSLGKPSRGRLHAVPPQSAKTITPMLTTEEFIQVRLATVRESNRHCFWPTEVLATFAAAEVIR